MATTTCGAPAPTTDAPCVQTSARHRTPHRAADGTMWTAAYAVAPQPDGRMLCSCGRRSPRMGTVSIRTRWARQHLDMDVHDEARA